MSPEEPGGVELVLHLADEPARAFQQASRQVGRPVLSFRSDDYAAEAQRLKAKGVVFVKEPGRMDCGGIDRATQAKLVPPGREQRGEVKKLRRVTVPHGYRPRLGGGS